MKNMVADEIRRMAGTENVAVLGIGPCAEMETEPPGYRPADLLPGARSLICFGIPVPQGVYQAALHATEMVWRSQNQLYRRLDALSLAVAQLVERHGGLAAPIFGCFPMAINGRGEVAGYVNQLRMGALTGIGAIGRNGLLLHRLYGARLMLGGVLTTIELPRVRVPDIEQPECPPGCRTCIDSCPVRAISEQAVSENRKRVRAMRCLAHAARTPFMSRAWFALLCKVRPSAAARLMNLRAFDEHTMHTCSHCVAACPFGEQRPGIHALGLSAELHVEQVAGVVADVQRSVGGHRNADRPPEDS